MKTVEQLAEIQNFTVVVPPSWKTISSHGYLNYSPVDSINSYRNNFCYIVQLKPKNSPNLTDFAEEHLSTWKKISKRKIRKNSTVEKSNIGELYTFESPELNGIRGYYIFFKKEEKYYVFRYASLEYFFDKYFNEAMGILASFKLK